MRHSLRFKLLGAVHLFLLRDGVVVSVFLRACST